VKAINDRNEIVVRQTFPQLNKNGISAFSPHTSPATGRGFVKIPGFLCLAGKRY
jgi:hypothetical protein